MKRILIFLMLLAVAGGLLFAQVSFGGEVGSGIFVAMEDGETTAHVNDTGGDEFYFELYADYETESGNAGASFMFGNYTGELDVGSAYVWYTPIDILTIFAGNLDPYGFGTPGSVGASNTVGAIVGLHLRLDPMPGLAIGAGFQPSGADFGSALYNFGVNYTLSGTVNAVANLSYNGAGNEGDGQTNAAAGVNILALRSVGLTRLAIDASVVNLTKLDTAGQFIVGPRIGLALGDLSASARANIYLPVRDSQELNVAAQVLGQYPLSDTLTAGLGVGYSLKGAVDDTTGEAFAVSSWSGAITRNYSSAETSVLVANPYLSFDVFGGDIALGYSLQTQLGGASKTKHAIYAIFSVGF